MKRRILFETGKELLGLAELVGGEWQCSFMNDGLPAVGPTFTCPHAALGWGLGLGAAQVTFEERRAFPAAEARAEFGVEGQGIPTHAAGRG